MQKQSSSQSAFFISRVLIGFVLCAVACLIVTHTLPAFFRSEARETGSQRTLTFAERVAYQRAIEDVYWRHRIWPKDRPDGKPSLDAVMSQAQLEKKVTDYLRKSQALEDYWQRPITAEQLQAEMERMAKHTKQPEVLSELFEALGNDPFVIAECLARPAFADRLLISWYAYDQRIHGDLKERAESELQTHPAFEQMKQLSGMYSEIELLKSDAPRENPSRERTTKRQARSAENGMKRWRNCRQCLAARKHGRLPTLILSRLQEDQSRYYATAVIEQTTDHLKLATVSWVKESIESWLVTTESRVTATTAAPDCGLRASKNNRRDCLHRQHLDRYLE